MMQTCACDVKKCIADAGIQLYFNWIVHSSDTAVYKPAVIAHSYTQCGAQCMAIVNLNVMVGAHMYTAVL